MMEPIQPLNSSAGSGEPIARPARPTTGPGAQEGANENVYPCSADPGAVAAIAGGYHSTPFDVLGMHPLTVGRRSRLSRSAPSSPRRSAVSVIRGGQTVSDGARPSRRPLRSHLPGRNGILPLSPFHHPARHGRAPERDATKSKIRTAILPFSPISICTSSTRAPTCGCMKSWART